MPRSFDPGVLLELVLDVDRASDPPPTFFAYAMTARQWLAFAEEYDRLFECETATQQTKQALALLEKYIVGWRHFADEFQPARLADQLQAGETMELLGHLYRASRLSHDDKKKSASPPSSNSAGSAASAGESASTPPAS